MLSQLHLNTHLIVRLFTYDTLIYMEEKRYRIAKKKMILTYVLVGVIIETFVLGGYAIGPILGFYDEFNPIILVAVGVAIAVMMTVFCILGIRNSYYLIDKKGIRYVKPGKDSFYAFDQIIYIDEKYSEKHKVLLAYTNIGKEIVLPFDEQGEIYKAALKNCDKLVSREEFIFRFPNTKV